MADCGGLAMFADGTDNRDPDRVPHEASVLEVCVYPIISQHQMRKIARTIRTWAGLPATRESQPSAATV